MLKQKNQPFTYLMWSILKESCSWEIETCGKDYIIIELELRINLKKFL